MEEKKAGKCLNFVKSMWESNAEVSCGWVSFLYHILSCSAYYSYDLKSPLKRKVYKMEETHCSIRKLNGEKKKYQYFSEVFILETRKLFVVLLYIRIHWVNQLKTEEIGIKAFSKLKKMLQSFV